MLGSSLLQAVLLESVQGVGNKGDMVNIQNGFMKNYLLPQKLAKPATAGILKCVPLSH